MEQWRYREIKFFTDNGLDTGAIMLLVLQSATGMRVARLMSLVDKADGIQVQVRWKD